MRTRPKILIIDDDKTLCRSLKELLGDDYRIFITGQGETAQKLFKKHGFSAALVDLTLPDMRGEALLEQFHTQRPSMPVIILTAAKELDSALHCFRKGAYDYVLKPFNADELKKILANACETRALRRRVEIFEQWRQQQGGKPAIPRRETSLTNSAHAAVSSALSELKSGNGLLDILNEAMEREAILRALSMNQWSQVQSAEWLGIHVNTLAQKMKKLGIQAVKGPLDKKKK